MQDGVKLERKTKDELKQIAQGLGIEKISALKKDEIIALIREKREQIANEEKQKVQPKKRERPADAVEVKGVLDVMTDGFGFLRMENYMSGKNDIYVSPTQIRRFNLKTGDEIVGDCRPSQDEDKFSPLLFVKTINGDPLEIALKRRPFERLTPIYPKEKISLDTGDRTRTASRLIDLIAPIGKGQRGMIVAPPKAGKTTILKQIAQSISENYPDIKLIVLLIDERPEEVTDIKRSIDGEVIYSTFDQMPENHCKVAEMVLERASRLVEQKKDVLRNYLETLDKQINAYGFKFSLNKFVADNDKEVYTLDIASHTHLFAIKQLQYNIRHTFKVKQSNRHSILANVKTFLNSNIPVYVIRTDISSFYESIPHNRLMPMIFGNTLLSNKSKAFIKGILGEYENIKDHALVSPFQGIPRGIGISSYLSELYMRDIDTNIACRKEVMYYARSLLFLPHYLLELL